MTETLTNGQGEWISIHVIIANGGQVIVRSSICGPSVNAAIGNREGFCSVLVRGAVALDVFAR